MTIDDIRTFCCGLAGTTEDVKWQSDLAFSVGGKMYLVGGDEDLRPLAAKVNSEVRKQYILGFSPSGRGELKYRVVFVSVTKKGNWLVRTRRGYRGTAPEASASVNIQRKEGS